MSSRPVVINPIEMVVGRGVILVAHFFSDKLGDTPANPTTVTWRVQRVSDGSDDISFVSGVANEATTPETGVFEFRYASDESGIVKYRCEGTGAIEDAMEWQIRYRASAFDSTPGAGP